MQVRTQRRLRKVLLPQPDVRKNFIEVQRLKNKVGNRSNSSSEVEFKDA